MKLQGNLLLLFSNIIVSEKMVRISFNKHTKNLQTHKLYQQIILNVDLTSIWTTMLEFDEHVIKCSHSLLNLDRLDARQAEEFNLYRLNLEVESDEGEYNALEILNQIVETPRDKTED